MRSSLECYAYSLYKILFFILIFNCIIRLGDIFSILRIISIPDTRVGCGTLRNRYLFPMRIFASLGNCRTIRMRYRSGSGEVITFQVPMVRPLWSENQ